MTKSPSKVPLWLIQAFVAFVFFHFVVGPVFRLTFQNGGYVIGSPMMALLGILLLLPFWAIQVLALRVNQGLSFGRTCLVLFGTYLMEIGPAIAVAWAITTRLESRTLQRLLLAMSLSIGFTTVFFVFMQGYAVLIGELAVRLIV